MNDVDYRPGTKVCAVCGMVLHDNRRSADDGEVRYWHDRPDDQDHVAVPVKPGEVPGFVRCNICDREATHQVPVDDFPMMEVVEPGLTTTRMSQGGWALDEHCAQLLEAGNVMGPVKRWRDAKPAGSTSAGQRQYLAGVYRTLLTKVQGPVTPGSDASPGGTYPRGS